MSDPSHDVEPSDQAPPPRPSWKLWVVLGILGLTATGLVAWYVMQRESPTVVVQRFWSALKGDRFEQAYDLIDWPEDQHMDEKTFVQTAKAVRGIASIQKYKLGDARRDGETAVVPVTVTINVISLTGMQERTDTVDMRCRFVKGRWKVRPDVKQGFLGLSKLSGSQSPGG